MCKRNGISTAEGEAGPKGATWSCTQATSLMPHEAQLVGSMTVDGGMIMQKLVSYITGRQYM